MKLFLTSNTNFGYRQHLSSKQWLHHMSQYFDTDLIPMLNKYSNKNDKLIHFGNLFVGQNLSLIHFNKVIEIFEYISKILPVYFLINQNDISSDNYEINTINILKNIPNIHIITEQTIIDDIQFIPNTNNLIEKIKFEGKYLCFNSDYKNHSGKELIVNTLDRFEQTFCGFYGENSIDDIIDIGSPYQLEKSDSRYGITIYDTEKKKSILMENKTSPRFKILKIENDEDLRITDIVKNDITELVVDTTYFEENKILIDIFVNKHDIKRVSFKDFGNQVERIPIDVNAENFNLNELIMDKIKSDQNLSNEFKKILEIYKSKEK